ncbi:hypothetical protein [Glaciimonas soli]|nr:hypothetical protein [Glaciimonas soli]
MPINEIPWGVIAGFAVHAVAVQFAAFRYVMKIELRLARIEAKMGIEK